MAAMERLGKGDFEGALQIVDQAAAALPDRVIGEALALPRGWALVCLGRHAEALVNLEKAAKLFPHLGPVWYFRGEALAQLGRDKQALSSFKKAITHMPTDAQAWSGEAAVLLKLARYDEAVSSCEQALKLRPDDARTWCNKCTALVALKRYEDSLLCFDESIRHAPDLAQAWANRGATLAMLGRLEQALASYDEAVKHDARDPVTWFSRGGVLMVLQRLQDAVHSLETANDCKDDGYPEAWSHGEEALASLSQWLHDRVPPKRHVEAFELVAFIEERLHMFIRQRLQQGLGKEDEQWWARGVPLPIRQKCAQRREEDLRRRPLYNQTDLLDLKDVLDKNWKHFELDFQRVNAQFEGKKTFLDTLDRLNEVRKEVMHPERGASPKMTSPSPTA